MPRVLYITPNSPLPADRGGRLRAHHLWRALSQLVETVPIIIGDSSTPSARRIVRRVGGVFYPRRRYSKKALLTAIDDGGTSYDPGLWEITPPEDMPDSVWAALEGVDALNRHQLNPRRVERLLRHIRKLSPDLVILCDTTLSVLAPRVAELGIKVVAGPHNMDSQLYRHIAEAAPSAAHRQWAERAAKAFEAAEELFIKSVDQVWVCSKNDHERFASKISAERILVIPNVYDSRPYSPLPNGNVLVYVGQYNYFPNEVAALRLIEISKVLDARGVPHALRLVGRPVPSIEESAKSAPSVQVVGRVDDVSQELERASVVPVPLTLGGGTRLKVLEAMAHGRPLITTALAIEGIEASAGVHAIFENDLDRFPDRIAELLANREMAEKLVANSAELLSERYSHQALTASLRASLTELGVIRSREYVQPENPFGAAATMQRCSYNETSRLLRMQLLITAAAPAEAISLVLETRSGSALVNSFVKARPTPDRKILAEGTSVLPLGMAPSDLCLVAWAWGERLGMFPIENVELERAGLISIELDRVAGNLTVEAWSDESGAQIKVDGVLLSLVGDAHAPITQGSLNSARIPKKVEVLVPVGKGQSTTDLGVWNAERTPSSFRLDRLRDVHKGQVAWLIGNGPSVHTEELDQLQGKLCFGFNRFHLAHERTSLRATYTVSADKQMIEDFGQEIVDKSGGLVFVAHSEPPALVGDYVWLRQFGLFPALFSYDPCTVVNAGGSSLFVAMQVAYFMGVRHFYLYGTDFKFIFENNTGTRDAFRSAKGDGNHFIKNYRGGRAWCPPSLPDIGSAFLNARKLMERRGGWIRNASRGGLLEIFDRQNFEEAVKSA